MSKQLVELTPEHHWFNQREVADDFVIKPGYNATFVLQPADGQHPYFDYEKQEWTDEPVVPTAQDLINAQVLSELAANKLAQSKINATMLATIATSQLTTTAKEAN